MPPRTQYSFLSLEHRLARFESELLERNRGSHSVSRLLQWVCSNEGRMLRLQYGLSEHQARMVVCRLLVVDAQEKLDVLLQCGNALWENRRFQDMVIRIAAIASAVRNEFYSHVRNVERVQAADEVMIASSIADGCDGGTGS